MLDAGDKLGPYEILSPLGEGGMGEVWKARDTRLDRIVALKVSKREFTERFEREARAISALNHPHICQLYDVGPNYLVMEFAEGEPLLSPRKPGPLPVEKALEYSRQILDALDHAHRHKITHRDLKPANIMITRQGVKLLDFGLAKLETGPLQETDETVTQALTKQGQIVGTLQYMSPEQLQGKPADARSDIFSFGAVLYEMLSGKRAFEGSSVASVIAAVLERQPAPLELSPPLDRVIRACLEKDPEQRMQTARDARRALEWAAEPERSDTSTRTPSSTKLAWAAAGVLAAALGVLAFMHFHRAAPAPRKWVRLDVDLGAHVSLPTRGYIGDTVIVSPEGDRLAYTSGSPQKLFVRRLDQPAATELAGTEGAIGPFFSPDGQWLGFAVGGTKKKISVEGGAAVPLPAYLGYVGATWSEDGNIVVGSPLGLLRIPSGGGSPVTLMGRGDGELGPGYPAMLPGGKAVLFTSLPALDPDSSSVDVVNLADHRRKVLTKGANPLFVPSGHLIYTNRTVLFAVPFDPDKLEIRGTPVPVLDDIEPDNQGFGEVSVSQNGTLVYRRANGAAAGESSIDWLDATGRKQSLLAKPGFYSNPRFSPDGKRLAMVVRELSGQNVSVWNLERGNNTQLSASSGTVFGLAWSTDGRYVVFGGVGTPLMAVRSDGSGQPQPLFQSALFQSDNGFPAPIPSFFTSGGKTLVFSDLIERQIFTVPVQDQGGQLKAGKPEQLLKTASQDLSPAVSPNGRWLAYQSQSNATGSEIRVRLLSGAGDQVQVSNNGGTQPVWSPNKHDLLYQSGDQIMAVSYVEKGDTFVPEKPRVWLAKLDGATGWDLNPDGKRVAVITPANTSETEHEIVMWQNFFDYLRQRVPVK
jgi:serine/threonine-protein kinase